MPTIFNQKGYRFFFYSNEHLPIHIHIEKDNKTAKFEILPTLLIKSKKFNASEIKEVRNLVEENSELIKNKWNEYFNN
ncbi:DUF4160 domain-containing protein [Aequorivita lipolytica]|uniref:DUF4160 domain-containing protein n=1 Tax=Aequorivita lipolytica TaxID=153267 RepID=A0A5C6YSS7_9FLAO|nr:DUF4160 domain-containing protein [Aequorivita lipolytica]TXD70093.1 DUF4160 domain-containing protein [Aequorivita lipolytica]SRX50503.1 hypothetical protein AEQU2_00976 [Aequorivita lipolytica]